MRATAPQYFSNSAQPYYGPGEADTLASREQQLVGQDSPYTTRRFMRQSGRYLAALGAVGTPSGPGGDSDFAEQDINRMEEADDTWGSGVFDQPGRVPTANENTGIFASSYSLPGFIAREIPFTVSRDVSDITDGAAVVFVPGGGLQYVEAGGRLVPYPAVGPTTRPGGRLPPRSGTPREQTYVSLQSPNPRPTLNQGVAVRSPETFKPARNNWAQVTPIPEQWSRPLPIPAGRRVSSTSIVSPSDGPSLTIVPMRRGYADPPEPGRALRGFGAVESGPSVAQYAIAGLILGAAAGVVVTLVKKRK